MIFPVVDTIKTCMSSIIENMQTGKVIIVESIRISNTQNVPYIVEMFVINKKLNTQVFKISKDELSAGDYVVDSTMYRLEPNFAIMAKTSIPNAVKVTISGYETDI